MPTPMPVAMIGVGGFGGARRNWMRRTGLFQIVACADRNAETLKAACAQENNAAACETFDQLLDTAKKLGAKGVVISTGADSHAALSIQAMRAGFHVFVEKPLCCSVREVQQLRAAAKETGKVVGVGHTDNNTALPILLARQLIAEGRLGTVAAYEENTSHSGGLLIKPGDWRGLAERNPGGMLFQCGVHALHSLSGLFGPVAAVQAMMRYDANPDTQTADVANVLLRHQSGMVGTLNCYHVTGYIHELRIYGTKGNLYIDTHENRALFQERKAGPKEERVEVAMPAVPPNAGWSNLENWYAACHGKPSLGPTLEDGINAVLPVFAAEIAAKEKRQVEITELTR